MRVHGFGRPGIRTARFEETVSPYRDVLQLEPFHVGETSVRFRLARPGSGKNDD